MGKRFTVTIALTLLVTAFLFSSSPYTLRPGDVLEISVYDEPDLKTIARVSYGGEISLPLLQAIKVVGFSPEQVEQKIEEGLQNGNFLKNPQVTVYIKEYSVQKVYVYGSVMKPGSYDFSRENPSILKAIAQAGGLKDEAFETDIRVIRKSTEKKYVTFLVNMKDLILGKGARFDIPLQNGDIISVPEAPPVYIFGEVDKEGIVYYKRDMRILQAVTMAGGFTEKVNRRKIMVLRLDEQTGDLNMTMVDFENIIKRADRTSNIKIQPYDIIIAPESWL